MKLKLFILFSVLSILSITASADFVNNNKKRIIIANTHTLPSPRILDLVVMYEMSTSTISVDFGNQPVDDYVVTISTPFVDLDYYATSPFTIIPLAVDGISDYSISTRDAQVSS